jgi:hypothetical protein
MNTRRPNSESSIVHGDAPNASNKCDLEENILYHSNEYNQNAKDQDETQKPRNKRRSPAKTAEEAHRRRYEKRKLPPQSSMGVGGVGKRSRMNNASLFNNLTNQDVFAAYDSGPDHGEAPEITATTKKKQLDQLLENSAQYDMHKCKTNKHTLSEASRRFGFKQMSVEKGRWLLRGMNTCRRLFPF